MSIILSPQPDIYKNDSLKNKYWILIFAVYVIFLAVATSRHEPWMDEAQAWLLAKDSSVVELFVKHLRYEGSPGLWHLILMLPAKLGLPYFTINVLSAAFSALGVWLFLRSSPFPPVIKILFPFSYFVFFQYGVVARSYCLIPLLLFLIAIKYKTKIEHPFQYVLLLCLLANVSTHTFLISGAILFVHLLDVAKMWNQLDKHSKINQALAVLIFGLMAGLLILVLLPPSDHFVVGYTNWNLRNFIDISKGMIAGALMTDESSQMLWLQKFISLVIFAVSILWLRQKRLTLLYLLPLLLILCLFAVKYWNFWHQGILFFLWVFVLWVSFNKDGNKEPSKTGKTLLLLASVVLAVQVYWSTYAVRFDFYHNYSGSYKVAEYIKANHLENKKIFVSGWRSIAILPYFDENIFANHNNGSKSRFWIWSAAQNKTAIGYNPAVAEAIVREQPDVVIFASDHIDPKFTIHIEGYDFGGAFEGFLCWKTGIYESDFYWVFRKQE
jgi:hypothetical protein